jgi:hypothetical protein
MIWRLYPFAILLGCAASSVVAVVLGVLAGFAAVGAGLDLSDIAVLQRIDVAAALLFMAIASFLTGGYVAARLAPGEEVLNAIATGAFLLVAGYGGPQMAALPLWLRVLSIALALPSALAGGLLYRGRQSPAEHSGSPS